jgi:hypothetical protein
MFIDLGGGKEGTWFQFRMSEIDPNNGDIIWSEPIEGHEVKIRSMKPFFEERIAKREKETLWKVHPKSRAYEPHTQFKELTVDQAKEERNDAFDYAITGIKGFKNKTTRVEYPCTREVKLGLMAYDFFDRFFADCQQKVDSLQVEMEEKETKNSVTGLNLVNSNPDQS